MTVNFHILERSGFVDYGGPGSGNRGHGGRPGKVGGSAPAGKYYRGSSYAAAMSIRKDGIEGRSWYGREPSVYVTETREEAEVYAQLNTPKDKSYVITEIEVPKGAKVIRDEVDNEEWGASTAYRIPGNVPKEWIKKCTVYNSDSEEVFTYEIQNEKGGRYFHTQVCVGPEVPTDYLQGRGKGNWGHSGRPKKVGGSGPRKTRAQMTPEEKAADIKRCTDEKWERVAEFGKDHKSIMSQIKKDFNKSEEAKVLFLINRTGFRVGGEKQVGENVVYGASTLLSKQVKVKGSEVSFNFLGKHSIKQSHTINDAKIAVMIQKKQKNIRPKDRLFDTNEGKVLRYLKKTSGKEYLVKDLRTHFATRSAAKIVKSMPKPKSIAQAKKDRMKVCTAVSSMLGNTPNMAKNSYINPNVWKKWGL